MATTTETYNDDELTPPEFLTVEYLTEVIKHCEADENIVVTDLKLTPGTAKGDHYASIMFRAVVEYKQKGEMKKKSMIIKTTPDADGVKKDMLEQTTVFEVEIGMYTKVLDKFEEILRSIGDDTVLKAKCLYHSLSPKKVIIFEDLVPLGYEVVRKRPLDINELKAVYSKLAKWHALSCKIGFEDPSYFDEYRNGIFSPTLALENDFFKDSVKNFVEVLKSNPKLTQYVPYFQALDKDVLQKCKDTYNEYRNNPQENAFYVLCHGDFHNKNLMLKQNTKTGSFEDVMLLDFQFCYFGPIANDLLYSYYMLLNAEQRQNNYNELLYHYYKEFVQVLKKVGFKGPKLTLAALKEQIYSHKHFELFLMVAFLPMWYKFQKGSLDAGDLMVSAEVRANMLQNDDYLKEIEILLPRYLHLGYFEDLTDEAKTD